EALAKVPRSDMIVLTSPDGALARLAAAEIGVKSGVPLVALEGGTRAWVAAGYALDSQTNRMADEADDVWLPARERDGSQESKENAMRAYLAWEIDLVNQMRTDDDQRFKMTQA
ncbi:MAG: hypothetical protein ACK5JT_22295, partial [Hyphomicrobiaceae bacterium]